MSDGMRECTSCGYLVDKDWIHQPQDCLKETQKARDAALLEAGRLAVELRNEKMCYEDQFKTGLELEEQRDRYRTALENIINACNGFFFEVASAIGEERMEAWKKLYTRAMAVLHEPRSGVPSND